MITAAARLAAVSALQMSRDVDELFVLQPTIDADARLEGSIWLPAPETASPVALLDTRPAADSELTEPT